MRKVLRLISLVAACAMHSANADPIDYNMQIKCPTINGKQNILTNYGDYIGGYGSQTLDSNQPRLIYFKSLSLPSGMPSKLGTYDNSLVEYNSATGVVSCAYESFADQPAFTVSYALTNGRGGMVVSQAKNSISLVLPIGLR